MLVIVSDLRLMDGSLGPSPSIAALTFLAHRLAEIAARTSLRVERGDHPIETIDLLLLGDALDLMRSDLWLDHSERPWHGPHIPEVFELIARITGRILDHNSAALAILRAMAAGAPLPVRIHYMVGDCDWPFHLPGPHYDRLRSIVAAQLGLAAPDDRPFPHEPAESDVLSQLLDRHRIVARHGDIFDPIHFDEDRNASSLGDAIAIEILGRFQRTARAEFANKLSMAAFAELAELGNHRPLVSAPARIERLLQQRCRSAVREQVRALWDSLVDRFVELSFVRSRTAWNPIDHVDGLLDLLKFSRGAASGRAGAIANWPGDRRKRCEASRVVQGHAPQLEFAGRPASPSLEQLPGSAATWPNFLVVFARDECSDRPYEICRADRTIARLESRSAA
jgi:hypothetical protein